MKFQVTLLEFRLDIKHSYMSFVGNVISQQATSQGVEKIHASSVKSERCTQALNGVFLLISLCKEKNKGEMRLFMSDEPSVAYMEVRWQN